MIELQLLSLRALIFIFNITMNFYSKNHDSQPTVLIALGEFTIILSLPNLRNYDIVIGENALILSISGGF